MADSFYISENTQQVSAEDLMNVFSAISTVEQRLRDLAKIGGEINACGRCAAHTIEIRAEPNVIHALQLSRCDQYDR